MIDRSSSENEVERTMIAFNGSGCAKGITKNVWGAQIAAGGGMGDVWRAAGGERRVERAATLRRLTPYTA